MLIENAEHDRAEQQEWVLKARPGLGGNQCQDLSRHTIETLEKARHPSQPSALKERRHGGPGLAGVRAASRLRFHGKT